MALDITKCHEHSLQINLLSKCSFRDMKFFVIFGMIREILKSRAPQQIRENSMHAKICCSAVVSVIVEHSAGLLGKFLINPHGDKLLTVLSTSFYDITHHPTSLIISTELKYEKVPNMWRVCVIPQHLSKLIIMIHAK